MDMAARLYSVVHTKIRRRVQYATSRAHVRALCRGASAHAHALKTTTVTLQHPHAPSTQQLPLPVSHLTHPFRARVLHLPRRRRRRRRHHRRTPPPLRVPLILSPPTSSPAMTTHLAMHQHDTQPSTDPIPIQPTPHIDVTTPPTFVPNQLHHNQPTLPPQPIRHILFRQNITAQYTPRLHWRHHPIARSTTALWTTIILYHIDCE